MKEEREGERDVFLAESQGNPLCVQLGKDLWASGAAKYKGGDKQVNGPAGAEGRMDVSLQLVARFPM